MKRSVLAVLFVLLFSNPALCTGYFVNGSVLLGYCQNFTGQTETQDPLLFKCASYITGVNDGIGAVEASIDFEYYCLPEEARSPQLSLVVKKYLQEHPEVLHRPAPLLVLEALVEVFPCK